MPVGEPAVVVAVPGWSISNPFEGSDCFSPFFFLLVVAVGSGLGGGERIESTEIKSNADREPNNTKHAPENKSN